MKQLPLLILFFLSSKALPAQSWQWARAGRGVENEGWAVAVDRSGNIFGAGEAGMPGSIAFGSITVPTTSWQTDWVKYSASGIPLWAGITTGDGCNLNNICTDPGGGLIVYGTMDGTSMQIGPFTLINPLYAAHPDATKYFLAKLDASGTVLWAVADGNNIGNHDVIAVSDPPVVVGNGAVATDRSGNIYITGYYHDSVTIGPDTYRTAGATDIFLAKYSPSGVLLWSRSCGGSGRDVSEGITVTPSGNVFIGGYTTSPALTFGSATLTDPYPGVARTLVLGYTPSGAQLWAASEGGRNGAYVSAVTCDSMDDIYVTGGFGDTSISIGGTLLTRPYPSSVPRMAAFLAQYSPGGAGLWGKTIGARTTDVWAYSIATLPCGQVWISASFTDTVRLDTTLLPQPPGYYLDPMFIAGYNISGGVAGCTALRTGGDDQADIVCDPVGNIILCGDAGTTLYAHDTITPLAENIFIAKYNPVGTMDTTFHNIDTSICSPGTDSIILSGPAGFATYNWSTGAFGRTITIHAPGTFWVSAASCGIPVVTDSFHVAPAPPHDTATHTYDKPVCRFGDLPVQVILSGQPGGAGYLWSDGDTTITDSVWLTGPATFWVGYAINCTYYIDTFNVYMIPMPDQIRGRDTVCVGSLATLSDVTPGGIWLSGNNAIATIDSTSGILSGISPGIDTVYYQLSDGCFTAAAKTVMEPPCVDAVRELSPLAVPELFPVPATTSLTIRNSEKLFSSFTITNPVGQTVYTGNLDGFQTTVHISQLPAGVYYLVFHGQTKTVTQRFVKI